jgi:hypothetical protein
MTLVLEASNQYNADLHHTSWSGTMMNKLHVASSKETAAVTLLHKKMLIQRIPSWLMTDVLIVFVSIAATPYAPYGVRTVKTLN